MSRLPNLGALRLTAPTSELFPITAEDEEKDNGGEPFEDPTDYETLPLDSQTKTFRVEKVPGNPERGYNWHDARNLAKWVKQQIAGGIFPVVDPYRTPMSKSDIDQLRFEVDQDIPPYDPSVPPLDESENEEAPPPILFNMYFDTRNSVSSANNNHDLGITIAVDLQQIPGLQPLADVFRPTHEPRSVSRVEETGTEYILTAMQRAPDPAALRRMMTPGGAFFSHIRIRDMIRDLGARHLATACTPEMISNRSTIRLDTVLQRGKLSLTWRFEDLPDEFCRRMHTNFVRSTPGPNGLVINHEGRLFNTIFLFLGVIDWLMNEKGITLDMGSMQGATFPEEFEQHDSGEDWFRLGVFYTIEVVEAEPGSNFDDTVFPTPRPGSFFRNPPPRLGMLRRLQSVLGGSVS